jgi:putative addiction module component (TIGR02574 family)
VNVKQIIESTKYLSAKERAMVARCLISSLETKQDEGVDQAWSELAQKRFAELVSGEVEAVSWDEIKKKVQG